MALLDSPGRVVVLGAGPTGLGAAWRLLEHGYADFELYEQLGTPGGLAASMVDEKGFLWDIGGHVQFSHYPYFDHLMDLLLGERWIDHEREAWVWMRERFIPYPLQNNLHRLPPEDLYRCLEGIVDASRQASRRPANFQEWVDAIFGKGLAETFMNPYNFKVWGYPLADLEYAWIGERVAVTDLKRVLKNVVFGHDDIAWGPNNAFRFPLHGGTGAIWTALAARLPAARVHFDRRLEHLDTRRRRLRFADGSETSYDILISTIPLDRLLACSDLHELEPLSRRLVHSSTHVVGLGLRGQTPEHLRTKCWMYFPEPDAPFYRATVFSNYSPNNVPAGSHWSLMTEVSESPAKPVDHERVVEDCIQGVITTRLLDDSERIVSRWHHRVEHGYPTPFLGRGEFLDAALIRLMELGIYSRGRFGAWKYEVSNQDHSCMQGVECVDRILFGVEESTVWHPDIVNGPRPYARAGRRPSPGEA